MSDLLQVLNSDNKQLSSKAITLLDLEASFKAGNISAEEFKELLEDIQRTVEIEEGASDVELKGLLLKSISTLLQLV